MAVDNTHTKYLRGSDKKVWENYKEAFEAQKKMERFIAGLRASMGSNAQKRKKSGSDGELAFHIEGNKNKRKK